MAFTLSIILLNSDNSGMLPVFGGAVLIVLFAIHFMKKSTEKKVIEDKRELDLKVKYQPFILAVRGIFPNSQITYLADDFVNMEDKLKNTLSKTVGNIKLSYSRHGVGTVNGKISSLYHISVNIDFLQGGTRTYNASKKVTNGDYITTIKEVYGEVMENSDLQRRILATTY